MKRIITFFILILAIIMLPTYANATRIDLLSSHVSTRGGGEPYDPILCWDLESETSVTFNHPYLGDLVGSATVSVGESSAFLESYIYSNYIGIFYGISSAEITFQPISSSYLDINAEAVSSSGPRNYMELFDTTTSESLFYISSGDGVIDLEYENHDILFGLGRGSFDPFSFWDETSNESPYYLQFGDSYEEILHPDFGPVIARTQLCDDYDDYIELINKQTSETLLYFDAFRDSGHDNSHILIPVDSTHIYNLSVLSEQSLDLAFAQVNMSLLPVPEPATMFLLGSGLIALAGLRRKFRKR